METRPAPALKESVPPAEAVGEAAGNYFISNYPPFSTWRPERILELETALGEKPPQDPLSLYVHIPFCRSRCSYCYFRVHPGMKPQGLEHYIAAILIVFTAVYFLVRNAVVKRRLSCPHKGREMDLEVLHRGFSGEGKPLDVESCSAFADPRKVECDKACIKKE